MPRFVLCHLDLVLAQHTGLSYAHECKIFSVTALLYVCTTTLPRTAAGLPVTFCMSVISK